MTTPMHLDPAVEARPAAAFLDFFAALARPTGSHAERMAEAEHAFADGEAAINRSIEATARAVANARAIAEGGAAPEWDYLVERLEFSETEAARDVGRVQKLVSRVLKLTRAVDPAFGRFAGGLARRQEEAILRFVEALRDARWQMMALRARHAGTNGGRVFDDPSELRRHLATI